MMAPKGFRKYKKELKKEMPKSFNKKFTHKKAGGKKIEMVRKKK